MVLIDTTTPKARHRSSVKILRIVHRRLRERLLTVLLVVQVFTLFALTPIRAMGVPVPTGATITLVVIFVLLAVMLSRSLGAIATLAVSVGLTIVGSVWRHEHPDHITDSFSAAGQVLTQLALLWVVSSAVFGRGPTTPHRILGAVVMYLSIGTIFTSLDILTAQIFPGAFSHIATDGFQLRETLTYYSFSTLTTSSFGDILPVNPVARSLANLESVCGQLFPATLLARIVSLHSSRRRSALR